MPSPEQRYTLSRRQLVALCGACAGAGTLGGYAYGGTLRQKDCDPSPLAVSPTEWTLPEYDVANTRAAPAESAPSDELSERWRISFEEPDQPLVINGSVLITQHPYSRTIYSLATNNGGSRFLDLPHHSQRVGTPFFSAKIQTEILRSHNRWQPLMGVHSGRVVSQVVMLRWPVRTGCSCFRMIPT